MEDIKSQGQASSEVVCLVKCASKPRAYQALKHLGVYVVNVGTSSRLHAKRTWTGPLLEASVDVICAATPRSRPEQQFEILHNARFPANHVRGVVVSGFALHEHRDGVAHAEAPSSTINCSARPHEVLRKGILALALQTQTPAK